MSVAIRFLARPRAPGWTISLWGGLFAVLVFPELLQGQTPVALTASVAKLRSADVRERREAVTALARSGTAARSVIDDLLSAAADPDRNVRFIAAEAIEDLSTPEEKQAHAELVARLQALGAAQKPGERAEAIRQLGKLGHGAARITAVVVRELRGELVVRSSVILALGQIGPGAASAAPELGKLVAGPSEDEAFEAAVAISRIVVNDTLLPQAKPPEIAEAERRALARLTRTLTEMHRTRQVTAALALSRFGPAAEASIPNLMELFESNDLELVYAGVRALASIRHDSRTTLDRMAYVESDPKYEKRSRYLRGALYRVYGEVKLFEDALQNGTPVEQFEAARLLSAFDLDARGAPWREVLYRAAQEPGSHRAGILGLGRLAQAGTPFGFEMLCQMGGNVERRVAAIEMLGELLEATDRKDFGHWHPYVHRRLRKYAEEESPEVRAAAESRLKLPE